jgi:hypothetical protein
MSDEKEEGFIFTPKVEEEGLIKEFPSLDAQPDEHDLPNITEAVPVTPKKILEIPKMPEIVTEPPDSVEQNQGERKNILEIPKTREAITEIPKMPETPDLVEQNQGETEKKELTEEEKRAKLIEALKQSQQRYHPKKQFGVAYKQKRKAKNKMQKTSRKSARKK